MTNPSIESRLLVLESAIKAIGLTHQDPAPIYIKFCEICMDSIRALNKSGTPENKAIAEELLRQHQLLMPYFPRKTRI